MILATCHSISSALLVQRILNRRGTGCTVVPVPRELSSSCGYAVETEWDDAPALAALLDERDVEWEKLFACGDEGYREIARCG